MAKDRIVLLDALRGLAILGIFLCNIPLVFAPEIVAESIPFWPHGQSPASLTVWWVTQVFFQQKFYTLFGLLFGASILLVGGEGGDRDRTVMIVKRLLALLAIGLFHGFVIWQGDVLWTYASVGLIALLVRGWSARRLLTAGILIHLGINGWQFWRQLSRAAQFATPLPPQVVARVTREAQAETLAFTGDFTSSLARTGHNYWEFVSSSWQRVPTWPLIVLGLILMGMGLFKSGLLKGQSAPTVYKALVAVGLSAQALVAAVMTLFLVVPSHPGGLGGLAHWMQSVTAPVVSLGYLGLLVLAANAKVWRTIPALLAPVGQMAFTNYIFESLVMTTLAFGGRGPVLYGKLDRPALAAIVVATWAFQILASRWWLKRFSMGPLEWVWRLAYRGPTPLRRKVA
ncbi:DUF418 domain-containing protein [Caulobacter segnis]|uniref:DUF418 domain-containing protein n=2 Tax=Caulobacter segnis TaxID=88688 RepID=D5VNJ7_CAUST|nr:DUF418 domain-containing protein [Caulobacter segnis]ADG12070.1 protein of unknown function DUF405 [Caulobacter segnis ATCC 21756]AVQ03681.1 DUF418 domain-containing protein [Caulobacter segnis]